MEPAERVRAARAGLANEVGNERDTKMPGDGVMGTSPFSA